MCWRINLCVIIPDAHEALINPATDSTGQIPFGCNAVLLDRPYIYRVRICKLTRSLF